MLDIIDEIGEKHGKSKRVKTKPDNTDTPDNDFE
jgi:hypothetical protein